MVRGGSGNILKEPNRPRTPAQEPTREARELCKEARRNKLARSTRPAPNAQAAADCHRERHHEQPGLLWLLPGPIEGPGVRRRVGESNPCYKGQLRHWAGVARAAKNMNRAGRNNNQSNHYCNNRGSRHHVERLAACAGVPLYLRKPCRRRVGDKTWRNYDTGGTTRILGIVRNCTREVARAHGVRRGLLVTWKPSTVAYIPYAHWEAPNGLRHAMEPPWL